MRANNEIYPLSLHTGSATADAAQTPFEAEMARLIIGSLHLEVAPEEIAPEEPLFVEGLGLDSIDALELAMAISREYGVDLKAEDQEVRAVFSNLRRLAAHVGQNRTR